MAREIAQGKKLLADLVEALANDPIRGFSNKELAEACQSMPPYITRAMQELMEIGWARKDEETGRFHITARLVRITVRVSLAFEQAKQRLETQQHNYLNGA